MMKKFAFLLIILMAAPAWAGPIETSFCPDIPDNISFGDSPETIEKKVGYPPVSQTDPSKNTKAYIYEPQCFQYFEYSSLVYIFTENKLTSLTYTLGSETITSAQKRAFEEALNKLTFTLTGKYQSPKEIIPDIQETSKNTFKVKLWELKNNAILLTPILDIDEESKGVGIIVCPLKQSGQYDLRDY